MLLSMIKKLASAVVVGIALGIIAARYVFVGSYLSLIPWGIIGLLIGLWCRSYPEALWSGAVYGFLLAFSFMLAGYQGAAPMLTRLPFFSILGLVGAICGIGLAVIGSFIRRKFSQAA